MSRCKVQEGGYVSVRRGGKEEKSSGNRRAKAKILCILFSVGRSCQIRCRSDGYRRMGHSQNTWPVAMPLCVPPQTTTTHETSLAMRATIFNDPYHGQYHTRVSDFPRVQNDLVHHWCSPWPSLHYNPSDALKLLLQKVVLRQPCKQQIKVLCPRSQSHLPTFFF